jgi:protein-S-isoprenylcysteine O-methyltransferase Ste14
MTVPSEDQPDVAVHPPTVFFSALLIGFIIRVFAGGYLPLPHVIGEGIGGVLMLAALVLVISAVTAFAESGETLRPASPSSALLTEGAYRFSRNPIYLAMVLFGVGFGVATLNLWIILTTALAGVIFHFMVIPQEEAYLERKFGVDYREFKERTRRWV